MKMDKVAGSGNDEFYTPEYAIEPLFKFISKINVWLSSRVLQNRNRLSTHHSVACILLTACYLTELSLRQ